MAAFSPILKRSVSGGGGGGGVSWASVVANGGVAKKKGVQWQDGGWNLGVETRVYIVDPDHPEYEHLKREDKVSLTKYWGGEDNGGGTVALKHVPYRSGEMLEDAVVINGEVLGNRTGFSQMTHLDGHEKTSTIFGKLVWKFSKGVPAPPPPNGGLARTKNVGILSPEFFTTGAGKEYVGSESLRLKIDEALEKIENEGKFGMVKETTCLNRSHISILERFKEAYGAGVEAAEKGEKKFKFNAEAPVFVPKTRDLDDLTHESLNYDANSKMRRFTAKPIWSGVAWE